MIICVTSGVWKLLVVGMTWEDGTTVVDCTAGEEEVKAVPWKC